MEPDREQFGYVLAMQIVGIEHLPLDAIARIETELLNLLHTSTEYTRVRSSTDPLALPYIQPVYLTARGGLTVVFFDDAEAPVRCAEEIMDVATGLLKSQIRMALHCGIVYRSRDLQSNNPVYGNTLLVSERVMRIGDTKHILFTSEMMDRLQRVPARSHYYNALLQDLGNAPADGTTRRLYNFIHKDFGNKDRPFQLTQNFRNLPIGHILCIHILNFNKMAPELQSDNWRRLNEIIRNTDEFRRAYERDKIIVRAFGDTVTLVFFDELSSPIHCATEVFTEHNKYPRYELCMAINSGYIEQVEDAAGSIDVTGEAVSEVRQILQWGDAGHILCTDKIVAPLSIADNWKKLFRYLGAFRLRHDKIVNLHALYNGAIGKRDIPSSLIKQSAQYLEGRTETEVSVSTRARTSSTGRERGLNYDSEAVTQRAADTPPERKDKPFPWRTAIVVSVLIMLIAFSVGFFRNMRPSDINVLLPKSEVTYPISLDRTLFVPKDGLGDRTIFIDLEENKERKSVLQGQKGEGDRFNILLTFKAPNDKLHLTTTYQIGSRRTVRKTYTAKEMEENPDGKILTAISSK